MHHQNQAGNIVAKGWILMFLVFICIFVVEFLNAVLNDNLALFKGDEGAAALKIIVLMMLLHAFIPMLVCTFEGRAFRWFIALLTLSFTIAMIGHEVAHLFIVKNRKFGIFDMLDFAHHGLGIWVTSVAIAWARLGPEPRRARGNP